MVAASALAVTALAGPPFLTDDPEPVPYRNEEVYLAAAAVHDHDGWSGAAPQLEVNYGVFPEMQLHVIMPVAFVAPAHGGGEYGYGDTEVGLKYRFLDETAWRPQIGVFPLIEVPTGDSGRGLGSGHTDVFLPLWLQKSWGSWTTYGGGGCWINSDEGNRDWWFFGWLIQYRLFPNTTVGTEAVHETSQERGGDPVTRIQAGAIIDFNDTCHLLLSAGHTVEGPDELLLYLAFQLTMGPEAANGLTFTEK